MRNKKKMEDKEYKYFPDHGINLSHLKVGDEINLIEEMFHSAADLDLDEIGFIDLLDAGLLYHLKNKLKSGPKYEVTAIDKKNSVFFFGVKK